MHPFLSLLLYLLVHFAPSLLRGMFIFCTKTDNYVIPFPFILFFPNSRESQSSLPRIICFPLLLYLPWRSFPYSYFASSYILVKSEILMSFHSFHIFVWQFPELSSLPAIHPLCSSSAIPFHQFSKIFFLKISLRKNLKNYVILLSLDPPPFIHSPSLCKKGSVIFSAAQIYAQISKSLGCVLAQSMGPVALSQWGSLLELGWRRGGARAGRSRVPGQNRGGPGSQA
jgi:hypothetical protein